MDDDWNDDWNDDWGHNHQQDNWNSPPHSRPTNADLADYWETEAANLNRFRENRRELTRCRSHQYVNKENYDKTIEELELLQDMSHQFKVMVNNNEFSDFTFVVNGKTYFGHKTILASRSPVFAAMFRSNMKESLLNNVVIDDIECDVFEEFLKFLYCGQTTKFLQMAEQLLPVADRYHVLSLKTRCETYCRIDNKNAIDVLIMAQRYSSKKLMDRAIDYILKNLQSIRSEFSEEWLQFIKDWPELANSIFAAIKTVNSVRCQ